MPISKVDSPGLYLCRIVSYVASHFMCDVLLNLLQTVYAFLSLTSGARPDATNGLNTNTWYPISGTCF